MNHPTSMNDHPQESKLPREHAGIPRSERVAREPQSRSRPKIDVFHVVDLGRNLGVEIAAQARKRPFVIVGAAVGAGFVGGSLFGSRLGQIVLAAAIGYALRNAVGAGPDPVRLGLERLGSS